MSDWFTVRWREGAVVLLDQRELPERESYLEIDSVEGVARAIETLAIRGAPAIGCAAALGIALGAQRSTASTVEALARDLEPDFERLARTRPTAVNLAWALGEMRSLLATLGGKDVRSARLTLVDRANRIVRDDLESCRRLGKRGAGLIAPGSRVLTHCNAGALATAGYGTALGVVRAAWEAHGSLEVLADETRPVLQGARLTAWELSRDGIPVTVLTDGASASLMRSREVDLVIVGADRIAANGDVANKIGTYGLAVVAQAHGIPFYVAAPLSTIDPAMATGEGIPIEERDAAEVSGWGGRKVVPEGVSVRNPAFDVTPAALVDAIVTEAGLAKPPYGESLLRLRGGSG
ncbi:MAG: S-methyl-5-thioribose-1-phosphate isomerase [Myxococcota bacterium]|nr:S-methyl-5-thioribose-1-phosphate isomerase [Myxococcota bacterium]